MAGVLLVVIGFLLLSRSAFAVEVVVVNLGWHIGIAIQKNDLDASEIPEVADFRRANVAWIEFGWGDEAFYQDPDPSLDVILDAAFGETPAVMHLVGVPVHPANYYVDSSFLTVALTEAQFDRLQTYLSDSFRRSGKARVTAIGRGLYPDSQFYPATGSFSLSHTCNTWVAKAFESAGLPIEDADDIVRASTVMDRLLAAGAVRVSAAE